MSCKYCEAMLNMKSIKWEVRSTYAEDNVCEFVNDCDCNCCKNCVQEFKLNPYKYNSEIMLAIEYEQRIRSLNGEEVIIHPFTETIPFNFCPLCGEKMNKNIDIDRYNVILTIKEDEN